MCVQTIIGGRGGIADSFYMGGIADVKCSEDVNLFTTKLSNINPRALKSIISFNSF